MERWGDRVRCEGGRPSVHGGPLHMMLCLARYSRTAATNSGDSLDQVVVVDQQANGSQAPLGPRH